MKSQNEKNTENTENSVNELIAEITGPKAKFDNTDMSSAMTTVTSKKVATATTTHHFTGEKVTVQRTNRSDQDPFVVGILVHYPSGDLGVWRFYAEKRTKIAGREYRRLVRQTEKLHPGLDHMLGAHVEVVPVVTGIHEEQKVSDRKAEKEEKAEKVELKKEIPTFSTRKEAREYCKAQGIAQSKAQKIQNEWVINV